MVDFLKDKASGQKWKTIGLKNWTNVVCINEGKTFLDLPPIKVADGILAWKLFWFFCNKKLIIFIIINHFNFLLYLIRGSEVFRSVAFNRIFFPSKYDSIRIRPTAAQNNKSRPDLKAEVKAQQPTPNRTIIWLRLTKNCVIFRLRPFDLPDKEGVCLLEL